MSQIKKVIKLFTTHKNNKKDIIELIINKTYVIDQDIDDISYNGKQYSYITEKSLNKGFNLEIQFLPNKQYAYDFTCNNCMSFLCYNKKDADKEGKIAQFYLLNGFDGNIGDNSFNVSCNDVYKVYFTYNGVAEFSLYEKKLTDKEKEVFEENKESYEVISLYKEDIEKLFSDKISYRIYKLYTIFKSDKNTVKILDDMYLLYNKYNNLNNNVNNLNNDNNNLNNNNVNNDINKSKLKKDKTNKKSKKIFILAIILLIFSLLFLLSLIGLLYNKRVLYNNTDNTL